MVATLSIAPSNRFQASLKCYLLASFDLNNLKNTQGVLFTRPKVVKLHAASGHPTQRHLERKLSLCLAKFDLLTPVSCQISSVDAPMV